MSRGEREGLHMLNGRRLMFTILAITIAGIVIGVAIGLATTSSTVERLENTETALPTVVLDRNGNIISKFYAEEHRVLVELSELPDNLIHAILTREDQTFYHHVGFSFRGTFRALWNLITNQYVSGGSTITQQLAGYFFADRREFSITRKLRELWWALQFERFWTKDQILEKYLNTMFFGHGTYGVESASQFYFGHSASELTAAESAMLVIQLANPARYSPIRNPNRAQTIQETVLTQMVERGYLDATEAAESLEQFWNDYDYTRSGTSAAFYDRDDKAPYFSEYVRFLLENYYLLGATDVNRDGYTVYTTLDLGYQEIAENSLGNGLARANRIYQQNNNNSLTVGGDLINVTELLSLVFDIDGIKNNGEQAQRAAYNQYQQSFTDIVNLTGLLYASSDDSLLRQVSESTQELLEDRQQKNAVEGALIALENGTGYILAMVGGSRFDSRNQFNRAVNSRVEPGSAFKPLYYAAAIEDKVITPATLIYDSPVIFWNDDGTPYTPQNYRGEWRGRVLVREALARSMNVPSLRVLEAVGFSSALETSRQLLGIGQDEMIERNLVRRYPVGLGVVEVAPIEIAQAFSTFANEGKRVEPLGILRVVDRDGKVIVDLEKEHARAIRNNPQQVISDETAFVMSDILRSTTSYGTLGYSVNNADFPTDIAIAGKTGTTQNWADAWAVGFTPYITSAVWIGFDKGGFNSLGTNQTGAVTAGPVWAQFMAQTHSQLEPQLFKIPSDVVYQQVVSNSGLLPPEGYQGRILNEVFIAGTEPTEVDSQIFLTQEKNTLLEERLKLNLFNSTPNNTTNNVLQGVLQPFETEVDSELQLNEDFGDINDINDNDENFDIDGNFENNGNAGDDDTAQLNDSLLIGDFNVDVPVLDE